MPITLLTDIKLSGESPFDFSGEIDTDGQDLSVKHIVGAYVFTCKQLEANQPLFNDGFPSIIFMPSLTDEVHLTKGGKSIQLKPVWVCCGVIKETQWNIPESLDPIMVLRFRPSSFYSIFNVNPSVFASRPICNFDDLVDRSWLEVVDDMYRKNSLAERVAVIKGALSMSHKISYLPSLLETAICHIDQKRGNITVSDLLRAIGANVNQKWLQRNFVRYLGIPPKKYISLQRFIYTYGRYNTGNSSELLDAAMLSGYYDYNHFLKDFKQYVGVAPSRHRWVKRT